VKLHPVMVECDRWEARLERLIEQLDAENREREKPSEPSYFELRRGLPS